jgi:hypothetical protein
VLAWSDAEYEERQAAVLVAARRHQSWDAFESGLDAALADLRVYAG